MFLGVVDKIVVIDSVVVVMVEIDIVVVGVNIVVDIVVLDYIRDVVVVVGYILDLVEYIDKVVVDYDNHHLDDIVELVVVIDDIDSEKY